MSTNFTPGENEQEIFTDANGRRTDSNGKPVGGPAGEFGSFDTAYRFSGGKRAAYADVYPGPVNVHQNVPLSNFAIAWESDPMNGLIGPKLAPIATVDKRSDIYYIIGDTGQEVVRTPTDESDLRGVGATANEVQDVFNTATYTVANRAYRDFLPDQVASNADEVLQLSQHITTFLTRKLEYRYAVRVLALLSSGITNTATFATACGTGGKFIKDATQSTPYVNFAMNYAKSQIIINNAMIPATDFVCGLDVAQAMQASPEVRPQVVYDLASNYVEKGGWNPNPLLGGLPPEMFGLKTNVAAHIQNTAKKGQTNAFSAYLTNLLYLIRVEAPGRRTNCSFTTFRLGGMEVRTYRDEGRRGMYIEVEMIQTEVATNPAGAYKITAPIS